MSWIDSAKSVPIPAIAERLGLEPGKPASGKPTFQCPACGSSTRHTKSKDRRGAIGLTSDGLGWRCHQCTTGGDGIDLVSYSIGGARFRDLRSDQRATVREWFGDDDIAAPSRPRQRSKPPPPSYPPADELRAFWQRCRPVDFDAGVASYLDSRTISTDHILGDLARALPKESSLPKWVRGPNGSWSQTGHRLIVPLFDSRGQMTSVIARSVNDSQPKSLAPSGYSRTGLVMADSLARQILERGSLPDWWDGDVPLTVTIAEGEIDFLTLATSDEVNQDSGHGPAIFGIFQGSWSKEHASRIPQGSRVQIATHSDFEGEKYARQITDTFRGMGAEVVR